MSNVDNLFVRETLTKEKVGLTTINKDLMFNWHRNHKGPPTFREPIETLIY